MGHGERSDTELMRLGQRGASPAFAVLLHRHGPAVRARAANDDDPAGAVIATFVVAMRRLRGRSPDDPVRPWLLELADREIDDPAPSGDDEPPPLDPDEADEIWAELDLRWPDGKVHRSVPRPVGWVALVVALVALAIAVPYLVLTVGTGGDDDGPQELEEVVARPFDEPDRQPAEELFEQDLGVGDDTTPTDDGGTEPSASDAASGEGP